MENLSSKLHLNTYIFVNMEIVAIFKFYLYILKY